MVIAVVPASTDEMYNLYQGMITIILFSSVSRSFTLAFRTSIDQHA